MTLEIRETAAGKFRFGKEYNYIFLWYVFITDDLMYLNLIANSFVMPFHSYFLFVYLKDPGARNYNV